MSTITRTLGIPARLLVLVIAGGGILGLLVSLLGPLASSVRGVVKVNTSAAVQLSPLAIPSKVYSDNGTLIAVLQDSDFRRIRSLNQISPIAVKAILDVEDRNFYVHGPLDYSSILRAAEADLSGKSLQGGSTITQQLIKQTVLTSQRTVSRKIKEAVLAVRLQHQLTKNQILQRYLNTVYFGNGAYGIGAAAYTYFGEDVGQLNVSQSALLAAMIENPSYYNPITNPSNALARRDLAIGQMVSAHDLSPARASEAEGQPLPASVKTLHTEGTATESTFVEEVINTLENDKALGATPEVRYNAVFEGGLSIYTTLDPTMQAKADSAVKKELPNTGGTFTAALVAVDPTNGEVRALVPGNNSPTAGFDVVTGLGGSGGRQPGSSFKLFSLLGAISQGYSVADTIDGSAPCYFRDPSQGKPIPGVYEATNAEGYTGSAFMTLAYATSQSINCAYLRLGLDIGLPSVVDQAAIMGVSVPNPTFDSLIIGSEGVQPIQMAGAYATMADNGVYHQPTFIDHVLDSSGKVIQPPPGAGGQVVSATDVAVADSVLQQVVTSGTGTAAALAGRPSAGKTGTTDNYTNAWFDGYTPQLATVVWMGDPKGNLSMQFPRTPTTVFGGTYPAKIWHDFMTTALAGQPVATFPTPPPGSIGPSKYLGPPSIDVSGTYGQGVPPGAPTPPPQTPTTTCTAAPTGTAPAQPGAAPPQPGAAPAKAGTPGTFCSIVPPPSATTSTTSTTLPGSAPGVTPTTPFITPTTPFITPTTPFITPTTPFTAPVNPPANNYPTAPPQTTPLTTPATSPAQTTTTASGISNPPGVTCTSQATAIYCRNNGPPNPAAGP